MPAILPGLGERGLNYFSGALAAAWSCRALESQVSSNNNAAPTQMDESAILKAGK
jgi:hypothetical protein